MLARGELHCIGATTLDEYRKHIEKDAALERRFQPVLVDQPTVEDTISILRGLARALRSAPRRAHQGRRAGGRGRAVQPLHHRPLPARQSHRPGGRSRRRSLRTEIDSMPAELDEITRRTMQLEIEREALKKETDAASRERLAEARKGTGRPAQSTALRSRPTGRPRRKPCSGCASCVSRWSRPSSRSSRPSARYDLNRAAELQVRQADGARAAACRKRTEACHGNRATRSSKKKWTRKISPQVVSRWTGVPVIEAARRRDAEAAAS